MKTEKKNIVPEFFRKNSLLLSALFLSIVLMFVFKKNNVSSLLNENSAFLSNFELINFKPLFAERTLTDEEIFHFLMYNQIPVDPQKGKALKIQERSPGVYSYSIREGSYKNEFESYAGFLDYLKVTENEKEKIDEILRECGTELNENILKGNEEELAISPELISIRQKTLIKLFSYLSEIRPEFTNKIFPSDYLQRKQTEKLAATQSAPEKFVILTPDTVVIAKTKISSAHSPLSAERTDNGKISVTVTDDGESAIKLEVCGSAQKDSNDFGIEWFKILPTHSKIVFNNSAIGFGEDSLVNYLRLATDMMKRIDIKIKVDSAKHTISLLSDNNENGFHHNSAEGFAELEKMFNNDFNFGNFSQLNDLKELGSLIDSLAEKYEGADSAEWMENMNKLFKNLESKYSQPEQNKKEK